MYPEHPDFVLDGQDPKVLSLQPAIKIKCFVVFAKTAALRIHISIIIAIIND